MSSVTSRGADGTIAVSPRDEASQSATMIIAHGLGDTADGFEDVAEQLARQFPYVKFILPTATRRKVTINMGAVMPAWYDIIGIDERSAEQCDGIDESRNRILQIIEQEVSRGVPYNRIVLCGFSMGGALSLFTGLQTEVHKRVAGIVCLSGYLPAASSFKLTPGFEDLPVLHCHGTSDPMVQYSMAEKTRDKIVGHGATKYVLKGFPCQHTVVPQELAEVVQFLAGVIPPAKGCVKVKSPKEMSVKELKAAVRNAGIARQAVGFYEKAEFVKLLEEHRSTS